ncbi:actin-related protein, ARP8 class [Teratosphaeria nubilosa]|uniref:Actin-related protein, ARP8 class n=1 Tax=Teratosphaeria nubilosa TaxID=161662 RepID=A0A6G1KWB6_9PEZI|nr:actin-related protein, ARP8 class [Teratosphaeria nubilosa]
MVGKKSKTALLRDEGLQRTDNGLTFSIWPQAQMINQKNYYTEFLKRDEQLLAVRLEQEKRFDARKKAALDVDRARAQAAQHGLPFTEPEVDMDPDVAMADELGEDYGSKTIVVHVGSQNLRLGLATDALPKTVPMVIARRSDRSEAEASEPKPKRLKLNEDGQPNELFGDEFADQYNAMANEFKTFRRANKRRVLPNSRELVIKHNSTAPPDRIPQHSDPVDINWTEIDPRSAPHHIIGHAALRIPEKSQPRYRLYWPIRHGWLNEKDYDNRNMLESDFFKILEDSIKNELDLTHKKDWNQYSCVFLIPDLYEKIFVSRVLDELIRDFGFQRVCFMQESVAATFGAGFSTSCMVDVGAQKTSISCVEDGMVFEDSRINLKYGGYDVTETFIKMMLFDQFNYSDFNLMRRHDFLLAEELKARLTTMSDEDIKVDTKDFYLRAHGQETRKYSFKIYDEGFLAPMGYFNPRIFDHSEKLFGRHTLVPRSVDLYNGHPNDPMSHAQMLVIQLTNQQYPNAVMPAPVKSARPIPTPMQPTPSKPKQLGIPSHLNGDMEGTPRSSPAGSPPPEEIGTPNVGADEGNGDDMNEVKNSQLLDQNLIDRTVPILPLHDAILTSIHQAASGDERRLRDLLGSIMLIGGASKTPNLAQFLELRLRQAYPQYPKEILVGTPPRELDPSVLVWKGGSVFGKLRMTNDSWIGALEYDRLGARILNYKCMWHW